MPYIAGLAIFAKKLFYFALFTSNIICIKKINRSCPNSGLWFGAPYILKHYKKIGFLRNEDKTSSNQKAFSTKPLRCKDKECTGKDVFVRFY